LLFEKEAERISKFTSKPIEAFTHRIAGHEPYLYEMKKGKKGKCVFLERKNCTIYASRPLICRYYPFELKTDGNEILLFSPTNECLGIGVGEVLGESYFSNLFRLARRLFYRNGCQSFEDQLEGWAVLKLGVRMVTEAGGTCAVIGRR
jgi:Fe-S-cluster containining protein